MSATFTKEARKNILSLLLGSGGANLHVRLFQNAIIVDENTLLTDLTPATFDGYPLGGKVSSLWSAPAVDTAGDVFSLSPTFVFQKSGALVPNTIYGFYVTYDDGVADPWVVMIERYSTGKPMIAITDEIPLQVLLSTRNLAA